MDWKEIEEVVAEAADSGDPILSRVRDLRLDINHFSMLLWDPFAQEFDSDQEEGEDNDNKPALVLLDLDLSAQVLRPVHRNTTLFAPRGNFCPLKGESTPGVNVHSWGSRCGSAVKW
jgi:hypothetical protein